MLCVIFAMSYCLMAQDNHLIYIRYDVGHGNPSAIVNEVDRIMNGSGDVLIFYSQASHPIIATKDSWTNLRTKMLTSSTSDAFDGDVDFETLDSLFNTVFAEKANFGLEGYRINGLNDGVWNVTFIMSKQMFSTTESYELVPLQFVDISQLLDRNIPLSFLYYDDSSTLGRIETLTHPLFGFSYSQSKK